jgi:hypothetical protein
LIALSCSCGLLFALSFATWLVRSSRRPIRWSKLGYRQKPDPKQPARSATNVKSVGMFIDRSVERPLPPLTSQHRSRLLFLHHALLLLNTGVHTPKAAKKNNLIAGFCHNINTPSKDVSNSNVPPGFRVAHMVTLGYRW